MKALMGDFRSPNDPMYPATEKAKAAQAAAKAKWAQMTPDEKAAAKKVPRAKKQSELRGDFPGPNDPFGRTTTPVEAQ